MMRNINDVNDINNVIAGAGMRDISGFVKSAETYIRRYAMLERGETVVCAVSGGADSMCLLSVLSELGYTPICAHFNHMLRGEESDRDERFTEQFCLERGIRFYCGRGDVSACAAENHMGIEAAARKLRYDFLRRTSAHLSSGRPLKIATAHNAEDNSETVLLNLVRGTGSAGLRGIPPVRENIVRPLLSSERQDIEAYLKYRNIGHVEDSTNASDDYSRNLIRHHVMPVLKQLNPQFTGSVLKTGTLLREDNDYLQALADEFIISREKNSSLPIDALLSCPVPVKSRVIRSMTGGRSSKEHVDRVLELCSLEKSRSSIDIPGYSISKEWNILYFKADSLPVLQAVEIQPDKITYIPNTAIYIKSNFIENCNDIHSSLNIFFFKTDRIYGKMTIRPRKHGDKIKLPGRNCTKSLKKLFSEARIPLHMREQIPVISDEKGVVAVQGFGVCERCLPNPGDHAIKIEIGEVFK